MAEYEHYIKIEGLPICDFSYYRKHVTLHTKIKRAMKRLIILARITRHDRIKVAKKIKHVLAIKAGSNFAFGFNT